MIDEKHILLHQKLVIPFRNMKPHEKAVKAKNAIRGLLADYGGKYRISVEKRITNVINVLGREYSQFTFGILVEFFTEVDCFDLDFPAQVEGIPIHIRWSDYE